jgi:hypothetical protein
LRIAAGLLGRTAMLRTPAGDDWCFDVLRVIGRLPAAQREPLRCQVDWVEAYDIAEAVGHRVWSPARAHR